MELNSLIPWNRKTEIGRAVEEHPLASFQREMDRFFDEVWRRWDLAPSGGNRFGWTPSTDVAENDAAVEMTMELPGLDEKDVEVTLEGDRLIVQGEKRQDRQQEEAGTGWLVSERRWGRFQRVMPLPPHVDRDKVAASFQDGVLKVTLPKTEEARRETRRIEVRKGKAAQRAA
ncbi:MAG: Hsp20/alpha crystallin family protein [Tistlia sp.]|uniref:Hsp20/alpha crystallin family protein n=1 Tax=Tistlia sp. TaxID=3057121 RepID=UPI0034A33739